MYIDLSKIIQNDNVIKIDDTIVFDRSYYDNLDIKSLSGVKIFGDIKYKEGSYLLRLIVSGEMILPCSLSLVDVVYPFNFEIDEIIDENTYESEEYLKIIDNTIDIMPIIWQNIVVEIPMKVVSPNLDNSKLEGDGWKLQTEEEKMNELDPRLSKLKDLLDD